MIELLTVDEVATILGVRKEKVYMLMHWAIGYYKVAGKKRMSKADVDNFLKLIERPAIYDDELSVLSAAL